MNHMNKRIMDSVLVLTMNGLIVKINYSIFFFFFLLRKISGPLGVPGSYFKNHCFEP